MKKRFFYLAFITALAIVFVSCGNDDDGPDWSKDTLKGSYQGTEKIYPSGIVWQEDTVKINTTVTFSTSSDNSVLIVNIPDLLGDIKATSFGFSNDVYSFKLSNVNALTFESAQIPDYLKNWFGGVYTYSSITRVVLSLKCPTGGTYNSKTNVMAFEYAGTATYTYVDANNATKTQAIPIVYKYPDLKK